MRKVIYRSPEGAEGLGLFKFTEAFQKALLTGALVPTGVVKLRKRKVKGAHHGHFNFDGIRIEALPGGHIRFVILAGETDVAYFDSPKPVLADEGGTLRVQGGWFQGRSPISVR